MNNWKIEEYNGWKNYYTWNVALYLNNDERYYDSVRNWKKEVQKGNRKKTYNDFLIYSGLKYYKTPDGVSFNNRNVSRKEILNDVLLVD